MRLSTKVIIFLLELIAIGVLVLVAMNKCENLIDSTTKVEEPPIEIVKTPINVTSLQEIGKWEFLTIEDDEIIDTLRKGFLSDDVLTRVYHGTVRIGVDMTKMKKEWIMYNKETDSLFVQLPKVGLLDKKFIDEARTDSYYESGKWDKQAYKQLLRKAEQQMERRCLTSKNIKTAEQNGKAAAQQLFNSLGYDNVRVTFTSR